jgi:thiamine pyrophosphate-dependent acetolactate synthase large subunit-like protein
MKMLPAFINERLQTALPPPPVRIDFPEDAQEKVFEDFKLANTRWFTRKP